MLLLLVFSCGACYFNLTKKKELEKELELARKKASAKHNAEVEKEKEKEKISTGDNTTDFNNSVDILHKYSKRT